jgi:hypothetical protein
VAGDTGDMKRGIMPGKDYDNGVWVSSMSSLTINGDVEVVAGTLFFLTGPPISNHHHHDLTASACVRPQAPPRSPPTLLLLTAILRP